MPPPEDEAPVPAATTSGGKYVPPSMRAGGARGGESMGRPGGGRDDLPTLRISNLSEEATETDLRELMKGVGRPVRVHIVHDHVTKRSKGFAFVSFEDRREAEDVLHKLNGWGYANLILNVSFSGKTTLPNPQYGRHLIFIAEPREPREPRL
jgi:translation initiation factor 3 subunit G